MYDCKEHHWVLLTEEAYYFTHEVKQGLDGTWAAEIDFSSKPYNTGGTSLIQVQCDLCGKPAPEALENEVMESYYG